MNSIEFFKVSGKGKIDPIETSLKSLHNRRALLIKDSIDNIFWLINGTGVSEKTKQIAEKVAKSENSKLGFEFKIKKPKATENENIVSKLITKNDESISIKEVPVKKGMMDFVY